MPDWLTIDVDAHPTRARQMVSALEAAGLDGRVADGVVQVARSEDVEKAWHWVAELIGCHEQIVAYADPQYVKPYKPLEKDVLLVAASRAVTEAADHTDLAVRLLHEFVWSQGLRNANHRSAALLVQRVLFDAAESAPDEDSLRECSQAFWKASKPLIPEKEFAPDPGRYKARHLEAARRYVTCLLNQAA